MFGTQFYNGTTRRYTAVFGTLFNDIVIKRFDNDGNLKHSQKVPVNYAPMQKILARLDGDKDLDSPAMTLPRMSFEITDMTYDTERKVGGLNKYIKGSPTNPDSFFSSYTPAPYNITFNLNIMTKYEEDATKILEQILPFFQPNFTPSVKILDDIDLYMDIPITLNSISKEDTYEGSFEERRALIYTLTFTMRAFFFGPTTNRKVITFSEANIYSPMTKTTPNTTITVRPGLTQDGNPTTDESQSIARDEINSDDDWAYIVKIEDADE